MKTNYWLVVSGFVAGNFIWQIFVALASGKPDFEEAFKMSWMQFVLALVLYLDFVKGRV